jgi:P-type E1-E2 ATPase
MDALVMTASILAYAYSIVMSILFYAGVYLEVKVFFSAAAMVPAIVDIGKYLEEKSKKKTGDATEKLSSLIPDIATVIRDNKELQVSVNEIVFGDTVVVKNGEYVPVDGTVIFGDCMVDKSAITGESMPLQAGVNTYLISGSIITSGFVKIKAEKVRL